MTYGEQSTRADRLSRSKPGMSQWQTERSRGPILPMPYERKGFIARVLGR